MFDISLIPNRDTILEGVYQEYAPPGKFLTMQKGVIPEVGLETMVAKLPDYTVSVSDWTGVWTLGSEIRGTIEHLKGWNELSAQWYALKDQMSLDEYSAANPSKNQETFQAFKNQSAGFLARIIRTSDELAAMRVITNEDNYLANNVKSPTIKWDTDTGTPATSGKFLTDLLAYKDLIEDRGLEVTHMFCPTHVLQKLRFNNEIKAMYTNTNGFEVTVQVLKDLLGIPNIIDFNGFYYGKPTKQAQTTQKIWATDFIMLAHIEPVAKGSYPTIVKANYAAPTVQDLGQNAETLVPTIIAREAFGYNILNKDGLVYIKELWA